MNIIAAFHLEWGEFQVGAPSLTLLTRSGEELTMVSQAAFDGDNTEDIQMHMADMVVNAFHEAMLLVPMEDAPPDSFLTLANYVETNVFLAADSSFSSIIIYFSASTSDDPDDNTTMDQIIAAFDPAVSASGVLMDPMFTNFLGSTDHSGEADQVPPEARIIAGISNRNLAICSLLGNVGQLVFRR